MPDIKLQHNAFYQHRYNVSVNPLYTSASFRCRAQLTRRPPPMVTRSSRLPKQGRNFWGDVYKKRNRADDRHIYSVTTSISRSSHRPSVRWTRTLDEIWYIRSSQDDALQTPRYCSPHSSEWTKRHWIIGEPACQLIDWWNCTRWTMCCTNESNAHTDYVTLKSLSDRANYSCLCAGHSPSYFNPRVTFTSLIFFWWAQCNYCVDDFYYFDKQFFFTGDRMIDLFSLF